MNGQRQLYQRYQVQQDSQGWPGSLVLEDGSQAEALTAILAGSLEIQGAFPEGKYGLVYEATGEPAFEGAEAFFQDAIDYIQGEGRWHEDSQEPGLRYSIRSDCALAEEFGLPLISYEGGQHFIGTRYTRDVINHHPLMRELYLTLFEVWQEEGGGLFVQFAGIIPRGQNSQFPNSISIKRGFCPK